jgi:tetratricopeptide (TPR) repeat protein
MIKLNEALPWYNYGSVTQLTQGVSIFINIIHDDATLDPTFDEAVAKVSEKVEGSPYPLEYPEVLVNIGVASYKRDQACEAVRHFEEALKHLKADNHRRAITSWMLGIAANASCDFGNANAHWEDACALLTSLSNTKSQAKKNWYLERLGELRRDMAMSPRQVFTWLNLFEGSMISPGAVHVRELMIDRIHRRDMVTGYDLLNRLKKMAKTAAFEESAEIFMECGLGAFMLGNPPEASQYISHAVELFHQHTHRKFVARWMLGAVQWYCRETRQKALHAWEECISEMDRLIQEAEYRDHQNVKRWYEEKVETLDWALRDRVEELL